MKILCWNINGIRAILKKNIFINYIKSENPDIVCLNELKICNEKYNELEFNLFEYECINLSCEKKGHSGVAIFSKIKPVTSCNILYNDLSGRYCMMEFEKYILVCVYVMNAGDHLKNLEKRQEWNKLFLLKLKNLQKKFKDKELIVCGDLNVINREVDTHNFEKQKNKIAGVSEIEMRDFQNLLLETKLVDAWLEKNKNKIQYSYFTYRFNARKYNKGMRIDYFLMSKKTLKTIKNIEIKDILGSDHLPIILEL